MKKQLIFVGSLVVGVALFVYVLRYLQLDKIATYFRSFSLPLLALYLAVSFTIMLLLVLRWKLILKSQGHNISLLHLFSYTLSGFSVSYLTPTKKVGGEPLRAYLLHKHSRVPLHQGASSVFIDEVLEFIGDMFFALVGFIILATQFSISLRTQMLLLAILIFWLVVLIRFIYYSVHGKGTISPWIELFRADRIGFVNKIKQKIKKMETWNVKFFEHGSDFYIATAISVSLWLLMFVEYKVALNLLGYNPSIKEIFLILSFVSIAYLMPVPAAIGVLEALQVWIFSLLGLDLTTAIALSFLIRARDLLWTAIGLAYLYGHGASILGSYFKNESSISKRSG